MLKIDKDTIHPMSSYTATYCTKILMSGTAANTTTILHILTLLKEISHVFPKKELKVNILLLKLILKIYC